MKVDLSKEACGINEVGDRVPETILGWAILHMMSQENTDMFKRFNIDPNSKPIMVDVECTVNGVSVDLRELVERMWSAYNEDINKCASKLIEEKCGDVENLLSDITRLARDRFPAREDW